jgi:serine/threonine-protein kinase
MTEPSAALGAAFASDYRLEREIGKGGMATVYLAHDLKHDRQVALKVLRPELAAALAGERFPREIQIIAQLSHPHILPLYDSGAREGFLFYVMPFVDGESLRAKLEREARLSVRDTITILREVADALAYAHGRGIVHRDIKPDNVMLSGRHAVVTDFGVAKAVSEAGGSRLTTVGVALGTPYYMSPEQAMGESDVDHRSDIYAVGALAYEMLAGRPPFDKPTAQAILSAHVLEPPEDIATKRDDVPPVLGELVMRCLAKQREDRWQTAEHMLPLLETATPSGGMTPTHTRPIRAADRGRTSRRRVAATLGAAAIVVAGVGSWMALQGQALPGPDRMAVMPIKDLSGSDGELIEAMRIQIIGTLGGMAGLSVAPASATDPYLTEPRPAAEIARELSVGALLEGNVFRAGERLRVTLQLTNPHSIEQIWSQTFDLDLAGDLLGAIAEGIRQQVAGGGSLP